MTSARKSKHGHLFWSPEEDSYLISLKNQGLTYREIANKLGRSKESVEHRWRRLKEISGNFILQEDTKKVKSNSVNSRDIIQILKEQDKTGFEKLYLNLRQITLIIMRDYVLKNKNVGQEELDSFLSILERYFIITNNVEGLEELIAILGKK